MPQCKAGCNMAEYEVDFGFMVFFVQLLLLLYSWAVMLATMMLLLTLVQDLAGTEYGPSMASGVKYGVCYLK